MKSRPAAIFATLLLAAMLAGCSAEEEHDYQVEVTVTPYGIPHIKADDWGSLGYGFGYHFAGDNLCLLGRYLMRVRGELSLHPAAGGDPAANYASDVLVRLMLPDSKVERIWHRQDDRSRALVQGYADGYNRYLTEIPADRHLECRSAQWLQPVSGRDVVRLMSYIANLAALSSPALTDAILSPRPPALTGDVGPRPPALTGGSAPSADTAHRQYPPANPYRGLGSNAWGLGSSVTSTGKPILLGNPHYPWHGERRFYTVHMTIPGQLDLMGAAIYGSPMINLGFTENFAWTHTVSNAVRFTLYELQLNASNPMLYRYDDHWLPILPQRISVPVRQPDGTVTQRPHTIYRTDYGYVINMQAMLRGADWTDWPNAEGKLYVLRDAALQQETLVPQALETATARSLDDFIAVLKKHVGHTFINTIAVGREGAAWYGDISTIPNLSDRQWDDCRSSSLTGRQLSAALSAVRVGNHPLPVLDGSRSECQWALADDAPGPGLLPSRLMAELKTDTYVANSNDSYWLTNPDQTINGKFRVQGGERYPVSLRTQMGLQMIADRLRGTDGLDNTNSFTADHVKHIALFPRNGAGERFLGDLQRLCTTRRAVRNPDVRIGCKALSLWDATNSTESRGSAFFMQLWQNIAPIPNLYRIPFNPHKPTTTPNGLNLQSSEVARAILKAMEEQVAFFRQHGLDPAAPLADLQYVVRNGKRIAIPGGYRGTGSFNMIIGRFGNSEGWSEIEHGNSYIQVVTWNRDDKVVADGILTYSQSTDPSSPHYSDQTEHYARGGWIRYPFRAEDVAAEAVSAYTLQGASTPPQLN